MAKAVLIMDMPENCSKCKFIYEFYGVKKCKLLNALRNGGKAIIAKDKYSECRHESCPLAELPMHKNYEELKDTNPLKAWGNGWNACIDKIVGGK